MLDVAFIFLGKPYLSAVDKLKMTEIPLKIAILKWGAGDNEDGGLIAWVGERNVTLINHERVFSMLSNLHTYCHFY